MCSYHHRFTWGTCSHALLRNDGPNGAVGDGVRGVFVDVAPSTVVAPSPILPPEALDPGAIHPLFEVPTGLQAYDFGFGATFFDYDNDGDQDLYWLGSTVARGEALGGDAFPGAGRMLEGDGRGGCEDITVRAHLLDIDRVKYEELFTSERSLVDRRISQAVPREREGSGARRPERRRLRGPGGGEQQRAEAVRRRHDGHSGAGVRVAERRRVESLAYAAAARVGWRWTARAATRTAWGRGCT